MKIYKLHISIIFMVTFSLTTSAQHDHSSMGSSSNRNTNMNMNHNSTMMMLPERLSILLMHSVAGFMNAKGGILIIGVEKDGHIKGLANDYFSLGRKSREGFEKRFSETIASKLGSDICSLVHPAFHEIGDMEICSVYIEKAHCPVYIREGENTVFFLRIGNVHKPLNTQETVEYMKTNHHLK